ncbi:lipid II flippase MurJ [Arcanobacterium hippocoleae]
MPRNVAKNLAGAAGVIAVLTVFSRLAGLLRKLAQSWAMSDGSVASAYDTANTVPNVLFEVTAGGALAGAVIPLIAGYAANKQRAELNQTVSALISWILVIGVPAAGIVAVAAHPITVFLFGAETDSAVIALAAVLLQLFALQIPLYGLSVVFTGVLQAHGRFVLPALSPFLSSLAVISVFSFYAKNIGHQVPADQLSMPGVLLLGAGTTLGVVIFSLPQMIPLRKNIRFKFTLRFPQGTGRRAAALAGAGLAALLAQQITIVVIMIVANLTGGIGAYTTFSYAYTVFMVPYGVLAVPVATAVFPKISAAVELNNREQTVRLVCQSTKIVFLMGAAAASLLIALAHPAKIVLEVGRDIQNLDFAMQMMAGGLVGFSLLYHVARVLYALGYGKKVVIQNSIAWGSGCISLLIWLGSGISGRESALRAIGFSLTLGLSIGALLSLYSIVQVLGRKSLTGIGKLIFAAALIFAPLTWMALQLVEVIIASLNATVLAAFAAALAGSILILFGAALVFVFTNRKELQLLKNSPRD